MTSDTSAMPVGVIAAMPSEARALGVSGPYNQVVNLADGTLLYICGVGSGNARRATQALLAAGAGGVVSWGTAGGLAEGLAPGMAIVASTVVCADAAYEPDCDWVKRLMESLAGEMPVNGQPIYSGGALISSPADKKRLGAESGAVAVDMESGAIAECATAAGIPFVVIRVVADPSTFSMPSVVGASLDAKGFISLPAALRALLGRPAEIAGAMQLAMYFRRATRTLALISRTARPHLLGPYAG